MGSILEKLTEGMVERSLRKEGAALRKKWERTGLLEGLGSEREKDNMSRLLENQAKQLLKEASTMQSGDVEGFASVAFPIVRRVFGDLIAEQIVSVQPMSLPSGLIFFLDFKYTNEKAHAGAIRGESIYGGGQVGSGITNGIVLTGSFAEKGFYGLNQGYTSPSGSQNLKVQMSASTEDNSLYARKWSGGATGDETHLGTDLTSSLNQADVMGDVDVLSDGVNYYKLFAIKLSTAVWNTINLKNTVALDITPVVSNSDPSSSATIVRRLTTVAPAPAACTLNVVMKNYNATAALAKQFPTGSSDGTAQTNWTLRYAYTDQWTTSTALGSVKGTDQWYLEGLYGTDQDIPEIDIKVDSTDIRAITKKLRAKWTPELGQDLDAYHNLDAEVELTGILSEEIALEIDREILVDLIKGATASTMYWSKMPGKFVKEETGQVIDSDPTSVSAYPDFTGNVSMWYETLLERINDVSAQIHRKTLRGGANFLITSPEVANILEFTAGFRASVTADDAKGEAGVLNVGSINKKWEIFVDPYFPRNLILVGRKGSKFLESGYVYAPYVPLQVTPTIFGIEDFTPRKGVMTRYGKKMVRPDYYGLVVVMDLRGGNAISSGL